ncbi:unnamed protein product [Pleuronectes platessa]|uniref:Uncharacterized protein n=1 Tax=Pleuronectes platessa TaxID=8262 RepID=A0A9N7TSH6_PLEPL|nr:unnamed protein product [Pleuronectes platessa]
MCEDVKDKSESVSSCPGCACCQTLCSGPNVIPGFLLVEGFWQGEFPRKSKNKRQKSESRSYMRPQKQPEHREKETALKSIPRNPVSQKSTTGHTALPDIAVDFLRRLPVKLISQCLQEKGAASGYILSPPLLSPCVGRHTD